MTKIKKIFTFGFAFFTLLSCTNVSRKNDNYKGNRLGYLPPDTVDNRKFNKLGCGTSFINDNYIGGGELRNASYIFDSDWIKNQIENVRFTESSIAVNKVGTALDYFAASKKLETEISNELNITANFLYEGINSSGAINLSDTISYSSNEYLSSFYSTLTYSSVEYNASLPDASNYDLYRNHLSTQFIKDMYTWTLNNDFSKNIFEKYGTHIITSGYFGTGYSVIYKASSNSYYFNSTNCGSFDSNVKAAFSYNGVPLNISENTSRKVNLNIDTKKYSYVDSFAINSIGGDTRYAFSSIYEMNKNIELWLNSKTGNEVLLYPDSYIPIWELIPKEFDSSSNRHKLYKQFIDYSNNKKLELNGKLNNNLNSFSTSIDLINVDNYVQGSYNKKTINFDSDILTSLNFYNHSVSVSNTYKKTGYTNTISDLVDLDLLRNLKFKHFSLYITFKISEHDDGDRTIGIFSSTSSKNASDALVAIKVPGSKGIEKEVQYNNNFENKIFDINVLSNNILYIRFGSCGNGFNAYHLNNVVLTITFTK